MAKDYKAFLKESRNQISNLVVNNAVKKLFANQIETVSNLCKAYKEAEERQVKKRKEWFNTKAGREYCRRFQKWKDKLEAGREPGPPPKKPALLKDELPTDPRTWFVFPPPHTLTESEKRIRDYALLVIVHDGYNWQYRDKTRYIQSDMIKPGTIIDCVWWGRLSKDSRFQGLIEEALTYVETDLDKLSAKTEPNAILTKWQKIVNWFKRHPRSYSLMGAVIFLILFFILGLFKAQWRYWCWGVAGLAFLVLVVSLLGGRPR